MSGFCLERNGSKDNVLVESQTWILLGASRGLGKAFAEVVSNAGRSFQVYSRKLNNFDASKSETWEAWLKEWESHSPTHLVYFVGGGPHGSFARHELKDHQWSLRVNFEFPMFLLHRVLRGDFASLRQICFIGSSVAESKADPQAATYASGKHALLGLIRSVQKEDHGAFDIRLFSPGYMDTSLLPANAWPRQTEGLVHSPEKVAVALWSWLQEAANANSHQVFE